MESNDGWRAIHAELVDFAKKRAGLDYAEGFALLAASRAEVHRQLGMGSFIEYVARLFGYSPRLTQEKLRVAEALESLPELASALRDGGMSWSHVRELTRVATPSTEAAWLAFATNRTVREVEEGVSGHVPGDLPDDPVDERVRRHVLRFEVSAEVLASFREAMVKLQRDAGGRLEDDELLLLLSRLVLNGPSETGRASYQIAIGLCESCGRATQDGAGRAVPISEEAFATACCDAQVTRAHVGAEGVDGSGGANEKARAADSGDADGTGDTDVVIGDAHVGAASSRQSVGAEAADARVNAVSQERPGLRAAQGVPPAIRRAVLRRDHHRCQVPGCRHATFVDVHHLDFRADGGGNEVDNLLTLCSAHHRAVHYGRIRIVGRPSRGLRFLHPDGTAYGDLALLAAGEAPASVLRALSRLGFSERDARRAIARAAGELPLLAMEPLLRRSLALLSERAFAQTG